MGACSGCVPSPTSTTQPQRAPGLAPRIQVPLLALNVLYPVKPRGKPRRKTSPAPAAVGCFSLQRLPQLPNPPGTRLSGSCHRPRPPAAVPGGSPPRLLGPLPSRWRIASQELLISSPEPGGAAWERAGGAEPARLLLLSATFQPFLPPLGSQERGELGVGFAPPVLGGCDLPRAVP